MKKQKLIILLMVLVALAASSSAYAAACIDDPTWNCTTSISVSGNTTTCFAKATSPGGSYNISMYGGGTGGKALHLGSTYYGTAGTNSCYGNSCTVQFTYTGSARPNLCNWRFRYF